MTDPTPTRDEAVPTGWKLVPVEPTEAMIEAHFEAHAKAKTVFADVPDIWRAMLASAPAPASAVDAVVVKALQWREEETDWWSAEALTWKSGYEAWKSPSGTVRWRVPGDAKFSLFDGTLDEAKAACEAAYDKLIRSALSPAATPVSEGDMRAFGASEMAAYKWPDDTPEHRAARAAFCEGAALAKPASSPAGGDQSLGAMLNHAALTIRGLEERIALYRANYTTNSALDHGRRQMIDDFEKFLHEHAALSQSTSDGRVRHGG